MVTLIDVLVISDLRSSEITSVEIDWCTELNQVLQSGCKVKNTEPVGDVDVTVQIIKRLFYNWSAAIKFVLKFIFSVHDIVLDFLMPLLNDVPRTFERFIDWWFILQVNFSIKTYVTAESSFIQNYRLEVKHNIGDLTEHKHHFISLVGVTIFYCLGNQLVDTEYVSKHVLEPSEQDLGRRSSERIDLIHPENVVVFLSIKANVAEVRNILEEQRGVQHVVFD